jgi:hypothetical protein
VPTANGFFVSSFLQSFYMKKTLLLALFSVVTTLIIAQTPTCVRDSSILKTGGFVAPAPYHPVNNPVITTKPACIGEPYLQYITLRIPDTVRLPNLPPLPLVKVQIATKNGTPAVQGLPAGLTYKCDPENCTFNARTLGCITVSGTPTGPTGKFEIVLKAIVTASVFGMNSEFEVDFPGPIAPGSQFFIVVKNAGECTISSNEIPNQIAALRNVPNPFSGSTLLEMDVLEEGAYQLEVFNLLGQRVHHKALRLQPGLNQHPFDAAGLANGTYYYSIRSPKGRAASMLVIAQ